VISNGRRDVHRKGVDPLPHYNLGSFHQSRQDRIKGNLQYNFHVHGISVFAQILHNGAGETRVAAVPKAVFRPVKEVLA
jgi:hypothetical protein